MRWAVRVWLLLLVWLTVVLAACADVGCSSCSPDAPDERAPHGLLGPRVGPTTGMTLSPYRTSVDMGWPVNTIASIVTCPGADGVNMADYDGDGDLDFVTACEQGNKIVVGRRDGCGVFTAISLPAAAAGQGSVIQPEDARFGDVDNDGKPDVLDSESGGAKLRWFKNNGGVAAPFDQPVKIAEGTQCLNGATPVTCKYMHGAVFAPGVVFAGSYSTGASVARFNCPDTPCTSASVWARTHLSTAGWVKCLEIHNGDDLLVCDESGSRRGVSWIFDATVGSGTLGTRLTQLIDTLRGNKSGSKVVTVVGSSDNESSGLSITVVDATTGAVIASPPFPSNFGRAQAASFGDLNGDGVDDIVLTGSHAAPIKTCTMAACDTGVSSVVGLIGPNYTRRIEISGPFGIKHDNAIVTDVNCDGKADVVTTEEKHLGIIWYRNPGLQSAPGLLVLLIVFLAARRGRGGWRC